MRDVELDQLIRRAQAGDAKAFEQLGRWMSAELLRFFRVAFQEADATDLAQETSIVVLSKLEAFEPRDSDSFRRYLLKVASFQAKSKRRASTRAYDRQAKRPACDDAPGLSPHSVLLGQERRDLLDRWIPELPDIFRRALEHELAGGDDQALAEREGISLITARTRRVRAHARLKDLIERARVTVPSPSPK
jgi:RNA polymerase sigma factor (sigma-70 family)